VKTEEDEEFERIEAESGWRKRQIMAEDDDDIQDYKKPWVGLTDDELEQLSNKWRIIYGGHVGDFAHEIEAKLKERNT
jgi:hypothetical protein